MGDLADPRRLAHWSANELDAGVLRVNERRIDPRVLTRRESDGESISAPMSG
jgi:hypothetical protein